MQSVSNEWEAYIDLIMVHGFIEGHMALYAISQQDKITVVH